MSMKSIPSKKVVIGVAIALGASALLVWGGRSALSRPAVSVEHRSVRELHVPHVSESIAIGGEVEGKKAWESEAGSTGNLQAETGKGMVPYSEVRARWKDDTLYLWLYGGDLDIEASSSTADQNLTRDDGFHIEIANGDENHVIDISALGTVADARCSAHPGSFSEFGSTDCDAKWQSRAAIAVDRDGTLNTVGDNDEEWIVEVALPLEAVGLRGAHAGTAAPFAVRRCEMQRDGAHECGSWRGELVLDP